MSGYVPDQNNLRPALIGAVPDRSNLRPALIGAVPDHSNLRPALIGAAPDHVFTPGHSVMQITRSETSGSGDALTPLNQVRTEDEDAFQEMLYEDANIKFIQWVAGYGGMQSIEKLMVKSIDGAKPYRDNLTRSNAVQWCRGERRISVNGQYILSPMFISARDEAYRNISNMRFNGRNQYPNRSAPSMHDMIATDELNELFARLTACIHQSLRRGYPRQSLTGVQAARLIKEKRRVHYDLVHYFKNSDQHACVRSRVLRGCAGVSDDDAAGFSALMEDLGRC